MTLNDRPTTNYAIEGGPEPKPAEDSPERLRERREALGLSKNDARLLIGNSWTTAHISDCEDVDPSRSTAWAGPRAVYAAALSAEEERRGAQLLADEEARAEAFHAEPERPAPRFKVGDAEARTAWQAIETAPMGERVLALMDGLTIIAARGMLGWYDDDDRRVSVTAWAPLPAAPEAP